MKAAEYLEVALGGNMNFGTLKPLAITEIMEEYKNKCVIEELEKIPQLMIQPLGEEIRLSSYYVLKRIEELKK